jgi:hypothetical protein
MADRSLLRWPRAATFAAVCVALAAAGHGLMSGRPIPAWALAVGLLAVLAVAVPLAGRERSLGMIAVSVLSTQLGLHVLFALAGRAPGDGSTWLPRGWQDLLLCAPGGTDTAAGLDLTRSLGADPVNVRSALLRYVAEHQPAGMLTGQSATGHQMTTMHGMPAMSGMGSVGGHLLTQAGLGMLLAHVCAALLTAWWLRRGEAALFSLARWVRARTAQRWRRLLALIAGPRPLAGSRRRTTRPGQAVVPTGAVLRHVLLRRGPPTRVRYC